MGKRGKLVIKVNRLLKSIGCPRFLHRFGPKKYEFAMHAVALLLKEAWRLSFRRIVNMLEMFYVRVPTYSALCKMRKRIPLQIWNALLKISAGNQHFIVAVDATGFSRTNPSWHYVKRIDRKHAVNSWIKLSACFDLRKKKFLALRVRTRPRHEIMDVNYLLKREHSMKQLLGDSAYDAESLHRKCFELGIQTLIKPRRNVHRGRFRKKQMRKYREEKYRKRCLIEGGFSSLKRKYGGHVLARRAFSIRAELYCKAIAHNLSLS